MRPTLRVGSYVRIKATGQCGRVGQRYVDPDTRRVTWGLDYGGEYDAHELEPIYTVEYMQATNKLQDTD